MKHTWKITSLLLGMFLLTQLIGLGVVGYYSPQTKQVVSADGNVTNVTSYKIPYGLDPPETLEPQSPARIVSSLVFAFAIAILLMLFLMKVRAEIIIRIWFFVVVAISLAISLNAALFFVRQSAVVALALAIVLAYLKIFRRNLVVHNLTELFIYPGIAVIFVSTLLSWTNYPVLTVGILFVIISLYDMYAVWHSGFMQRMARYQLEQLKMFTGFFVPYVGKRTRQKLKTAKEVKKKRVRVSVAILGGGDIVFPIIFSGVALYTLGLGTALAITFGSTLALVWLFYISEKGKFYPAMPFITIGAFLGLAVGYLIF